MSDGYTELAMSREYWDAKREAEIAELKARLVAAEARQTCEGTQPYICHALATARSSLAEATELLQEARGEIAWSPKAMLFVRRIDDFINRTRAAVTVNATQEGER